MSGKIVRHQDLEIYKKAFSAAMRIFELSKSFPKEEIYSLTDQIRRSSRSVCANTAEAWRKRRYEAAFISKVKMLRVNQPKLKRGWSLPFVVIIWIKKRAGSCLRSMMK